MRRLSIVIPVYNEEATISKVVDEVLDKRLDGWSKEIIVVNDGSSDRTRRELEKFGKKIKLINLTENKGKGNALVNGFRRATGEVILIQDADLEYSPEDYPQLLSPFSRPHVNAVYGSRFLGPHLSTMYLYALGNKFVTWLTNVLFNTNLTDMETGYKVFRKSALDNMKLKANRFDFEPEFTAQLLRRGYQIYEVPISYFGRKFSEGKKLTWRDGVIAVWVLIKYRFIVI